ncbi:MAG: polyphosphate polymerase domain-containing protein [Vicinamibacterales bacterium]
MTEALVDPALDALERLEDASPELLADRLLQTRVDRKFVMPRTLIAPLLTRLDAGHRLLRAAGSPAATYETWYFDTPDWRLYDDHRRGRMPRYKVRVRHQVERQMSFLEVKRKAQDGRTHKARLERTFRDASLDATAGDFIAAHSPITTAELRPALWLRFRRATILSVDTEERLTIDWDFSFRTIHSDRAWEQAAIVEIKQPRYHHDTPSVRALRDLGVRESSISKYCVGLAMLSPLRANSFKPALRDIERISA